MHHNAHAPAVAESKESAPKKTHQRVFALLKERLPSGIVLDIPCGSGAFTHRVLDTPCRVIAADLVAHPAVPRTAACCVADMNTPLPFGNGSLDAVVSIEGIEHIRRPFDFVRECRRVLRRDGWFFVTTPNISAIRSRWRWFLTGFHNKCKCPLDEAQPQPRHHINVLSFAQLRYMLHTSGFRIEHIATNRIKPINWLYAPMLPVQYAASRLAFRRGVKNEPHRRQMREILKQTTSIPILFGENMIVVARAC